MIGSTDTEQRQNLQLEPAGSPGVLSDMEIHSIDSDWIVDESDMGLRGHFRARMRWTHDAEDFASDRLARRVVQSNRRIASEQLG